MTAEFRKEVRRKLYVFTHKAATVMYDTRRQRFIQQMIFGVVVSVKVHLPEVVRPANFGTVHAHAAEKRLSRHRNREHGDTTGLKYQLLAWSSEWG
jgi:hypothetical protein